MNSSASRLWTCLRCLRAQKLRGTQVESKARTLGRSGLPFSTTTLAPDARPAQDQQTRDSSIVGSQDAADQGAMSRRLAEMAEETMDTGSKSDRKLVQDAGFSEELKRQLEDKLAQTSFAAQNQRTASQVAMPVRLYCGLSTRSRY